MRKPSNFLSLLLKIVVIVSACYGIWLSAGGGRGGFMGGLWTFMYFTIQSNIALALICLIGAGYLLSGRAFSPRWYVIKFVGTVSITLTGAVFCFVLAPTMGSAAWNTANVLTHVVVPIVSILDFFVTGIGSDIPRKKVIYVTLPPIAYAIYAGIGYVCNWQFAVGQNYPYFFLNWGSPAGAFGFSNQLPFMGCAWWILALLILLLTVGMIYLAILDGLKKLFRKESGV